MRRLRLYLLTTVSSAALIGSAAAADLRMPAKAPPKAVVAPAMANWTGPYLGINAGAAWHDWKFIDIDAFFLEGAPAGLNNKVWSSNKAAFTIGGQLGYNWQRGHVVFGIEGDLNWVDAKASAGISSPVTTFTGTTEMDWFGTVRGRIGAVYSQTLIYATGGLAIGHFSDRYARSDAAITNDTTRAGWTIGGGLEYMYSPHWTARIEALYADFGSSTEGIFYSGTTYRTRFEHSVTVVRGALNWKW